MMSGEMQVETHAGQRTERLQAVYDYHEQTKHRFSGYARGPATLDWDAQPNPFRVYAGTETIELPFDNLSSTIRYADVLAATIEPHGISLQTLSQLLRNAFGITAWKELPDGTRWALRANPSSGNLHPTEAWVIARGVANLKAGLYHYDCREHALQLRCEYPASGHDNPQLLIALSTIYWREAWKYGERAFRYCHLDIGHAAAALGFSCAALGWQAQQCSINSDELDELLGLDRTEQQTVEQESAACLFQIITQNLSATAKSHPEQLQSQELSQYLERVKHGIWSGQPNRLDPKPLYAWPAIAKIAVATRVSCADRDAAELSTDDQPSIRKFVSTKTKSWLTAENVVTLRRSAQAYDGRCVLSRENLIEILTAFFETQWQPVLHSETHVHLIFAVHRVQDMIPGLYVLPRSDRGERLLREQLTRWNDWVDSGIAIANRTFYRIKTANTQRAAATLCCQQAIASDSNFVVGFLAEFDNALRTPAAYCALYHEAGALAHAAYLRATALDLAGTGIGCFFDDEWHDLLGIQNTSLQFVYHFAAGKPLHDARLLQRPGYFHLPDTRFSGRRFA